MSATKLRAKPDGGVRVLGHPNDLPPDQLVKLRAYKDELAPIIAAYGEVEIVIRPATAMPPASCWSPKPPLPRHWQDLDGWRALLAYAHVTTNRRWAVARWARAAGGEVRDGVLHLPAGLPRGLVLAELKTHARMIGIEVPA